MAVDHEIFAIAYPQPPPIQHSLSDESAAFISVRRAGWAGTRQMQPVDNGVRCDGCTRSRD